MKLVDLIDRGPVEPWQDGGRIPWDDPAFSERMLREHLTQAHDRASRRSAKIDRHVDWIHRALLGGEPTRVLDLGCGPGLYSARLARLGHTCVGIDCSPASLAWAQSEAEREGLACEYRQADLREADYGRGFGAALQIFGELNTFPRADAARILRRAHSALDRGGLLALEVHSEAFVREAGGERPVFVTERSGLFADEPYLCLRECAWSPELRASAERYLIVDLGSGTVTRYVSTLQAYSEDEYDALLADAGFTGIERHPSLAGTGSEGHGGLYVLVARAR